MDSEVSEGFRSFNLPVSECKTPVDGPAAISLPVIIKPFVNSEYITPPSFTKWGLSSAKSRVAYAFKNVDAAERKFWRCPTIPKLVRSHFYKYVWSSETYLSTFHRLEVREVFNDFGVRYYLSQLGMTTEDAQSGELDKIIADRIEFHKVFALLSQYIDLEISNSNILTADRYRQLTILHIVRHMLALETESEKNEPVRGWTKCRILILVPNKQTAKLWADDIINLVDFSKLEGEEKLTSQYGALVDDELDSDFELGLPYFREAIPKTPEYAWYFRGNLGDDFLLGISVDSSGKPKVCVDRDAADIIIASPLNLRRFIRSKSEDQRYDFLSSIEICVLDRTEHLELQNPEHLRTIFEVLNLDPRDPRKGIDITEMRKSYFEESGRNWSTIYRQNIILSNGRSMGASNLISSYCPNFRGGAKLWSASNSDTIRACQEMTGGNTFFISSGSDYVKPALAELRDRLPDTFKRHFLQGFFPKFPTDRETFVLVVPTYIELIE